MTVTGLLPSPLWMPPTSGVSEPQNALYQTPQSKADEVVAQLFRRMRYLLTLKGRPPFRLVGRETYERLGDVVRLSLDLLTQRYDPRLVQLYQGLQSALSPFAQTYQDLQQGAAWLRDIAYILEPTSLQARNGQEVAQHLRGDLDAIRRQSDVSPVIYDFGLHLDKGMEDWP